MAIAIAPTEYLRKKLPFLYRRIPGAGFSRAGNLDSGPNDPFAWFKLMPKLASLLLILFVAVSLPGGSRDAWAQSRPKPASAGESTRVALVIGNNDYQQVQKLNNAVPDAKAMAKEFRALGFEVIEKTNVDQRSMKAAVREFVKRVGNGGVGAFFFAGHGVQEGGNNYLLPVDISKLTDPGALSDEAVELNEDIMGRIGQAGAKFSLLVIDACRDNPFPKRAGRSVGGTRGLTASGETPEGMIVVYSAGVGQQALDRLDDNDRSENGLFTREFIVELRKPGLEVAEMVRNVRQRVKEAAAKVQHDQTPAIYIQADRFYLVAPPPLPTPPSLPSSEDALWAQLDSDKPCEYQAYLEEFPKGKFAALARIRARECVPSSKPAPQPTVAMVAPPAAKERPLSLPPTAASPPAPAPAETSKAAPVGAPKPEPATVQTKPEPPKKGAPVAEPAFKAEAKPGGSEPVVPSGGSAAPLPAIVPPSEAAKSKTTPKEKPTVAAKPGPFSSVPESAPVKRADPASAGVTTSSVLELPLPPEVKLPPPPAQKSRPAVAEKPQPKSKTAPPTLEITPPPADEKVQLAMLAPVKEAVLPRRTKREPGDQPDLRPGDGWAMRRVDLYTQNVVAGWQESVHSLEGTQIKLDSSTKVGRSVSSGLVNLDLATWSIESARIVEGKQIPLAFPLAVGKTWEYTYRRKRNDDLGVTIYRVKAKVEAFERIETPAGSFEAFKVVHQKHYETSKEGRNWTSTSEEVFWYAPSARRWVRRDLIDRDSRGRIADKYREEVIAVSLRP